MELNVLMEEGCVFEEEGFMRLGGEMGVNEGEYGWMGGFFI